jgi:hypothetical protein
LLAALAMEMSTPPLVLVLIFRNIKGKEVRSASVDDRLSCIFHGLFNTTTPPTTCLCFQKISDKASPVFALLFILLRLVLFGFYVIKVSRL